LSYGLFIRGAYEISCMLTNDSELIIFKFFWLQTNSPQFQS